MKETDVDELCKEIYDRTTNDIDFATQNFVTRICMKESVYKGKTETLAEYYVRVHGHLLGDVSVFEISDAGVIRVIREGTAEQPI